MSKRVLTTESGAPVADNQKLGQARRRRRPAPPPGPAPPRGEAAPGSTASASRSAWCTPAAPARTATSRSRTTSPASPTPTPEHGRQAHRGLPALLHRGRQPGRRRSAVRDPRGFAVRLYTEEGNYDLVGNNTVFFIKDPLKFPDFIHSQKRDPFTGKQEPDNVWDFWAHAPEATHQVTWLMGDRGIPASYRHMNGYGSHTYQWTNAEGEAFFVKYHFKTNQGVRSLSTEQAQEIAGKDPNSHQTGPPAGHRAGRTPVLDPLRPDHARGRAADYRFNPFDLAKVWPHRDFPLQRVGRLVLDRNPDNVFAEVEQAAFSPNNFVPGIGPSRQDAPGPAVRLRGRPPLPPRRQPHPTRRERSEGHDRGQLRPRRLHGIQRAGPRRQELRAEL